MSIIDDKNSRTALGSKPIGEDFGYGEIIVGKIIPQNTSRKFSSFITHGTNQINIDGTEFAKSAKGKIYVYDQGIICGNVKYPFDKIIGLVRSNNNVMKAVESTVEILAGNKRYHVKLEIITDDSDKLFSKLSKISMKPNSDLSRHTLKNQSNFLKDRFGMKRD